MNQPVLIDDRRQRAVEFRILGPLRVIRNGRPQRILRRQQARLLSALLLEHGRPVSAFWLADVIWDGAPPEDADEAVGFFAHRLDALLDDDEAKIRSTRDGYRLEGAPEGVDLARFRQAVLAARDAAADLPTALAHLRRAVTLWKGPALDGMDGDYFNVWRRRLEIEHDAAEKLWVNLEVRAAVNTPTRDLFGSLTDHQPDHARVHKLLERARQRSDWSTDDLWSAYDAMKERALQNLSWPSDAVSESSGSSGMVPIDPMTLGPATATAARPTRPGRFRGAARIRLPDDFKGRSRELAVLNRLREYDASTAIISGPAEIGKSRLAKEWALVERDRFPDGVAVIQGDALAPADPRTATDILLKAFGYAVGGGWHSESVVSLRQALFTDRTALVVLDGVEDIERSQVLLRATEGAKRVITTRLAPAEFALLEPSVTVELEPLQPDAGARLLEWYLGSPETDGEETAARTLSALVGGLPGALIAVAANLGRWPETTLAHAVTMLSDHDLPPLSEFMVGSSPGESVETEVHRRFAAAFREHRHEPIAVGKEFAVSIWLGDGSNHQQVEQAVIQVLAEVGLHITYRGDPQLGSWFRRLQARTRRAAGHLSEEQIIAEVERKIRLEVFDKAQAAVDHQQSTGAAALIAALQGEREACIQVGSLLLLKSDGRVAVRNLTQLEMAWLERNPTLLGDPASILEKLQELARGDDDTGGRIARLNS